MVTQRIIISEICPKGWSPIYLRQSTSPLRAVETTLTTNYHTPRTIQDLRGVLHEINDPRSPAYRERIRYITKCANGMFSRRDAEAMWSMICSWHRESVQRNICLVIESRLDGVAKAICSAANDALFGTTTQINDADLNTYVYGLMIAYMPHTLRHTVTPTNESTPAKPISWWKRVCGKGKTSTQ